jgi:hypothetical protein
MSSVYTAEGGGGLIWVGVAGFGIGYVLAKLKVVTESNVSPFATWSSCAFAVVIAYLADSSTASDFAMIAGKIAIFGIVWFVFGIIFTLGLMLGLEKANKSKS